MCCLNMCFIDVLGKETFVYETISVIFPHYRHSFVYIGHVGVVVHNTSCNLLKILITAIKALFMFHGEMSIQWRL